VFLQDGLINYVGYTFLNTYSEIDKAVLCFQLNTRHYPRSANAWGSLGEAYAAAGDRARAMEGYTKSLELDPGNANAARQLDKLRGSAQSQK
jgi:cytochrome c-type biogenesis protein CcmH/NrfG